MWKNTLAQYHLCRVTMVARAKKKCVRFGKDREFSSESREKTPTTTSYHHLKWCVYTSRMATMLIGKWNKSRHISSSGRFVTSMYIHICSPAKYEHGIIISKHDAISTNQPKKSVRIFMWNTHTHTYSQSLQSPTANQIHIRIRFITRSNVHKSI